MSIREDRVKGMVITEGEDAVVMRRRIPKGSGYGYLSDVDVKSEEAEGDSRGL
jgi:hypothetical protein